MTSEGAKSKDELLGEIARLRQQLGDLEQEASERARRAQAQAREQIREQTLAIAETTRDPCVVLDARCHIVRVNPAFTRTFGIPSEEAEGQRLSRLRDRNWDIPALRALISEVADSDTPVVDAEIGHEFLDLGPQQWIVNARRVGRTESFAGLIVVSIENVTEQHRVKARVESTELERQFLVRTALELAVFPFERNIYDYIGERLQELCGDAIVMVLDWDRDSAVLVCRSVVGLGNRSRAILELLGRHPVGMQFAILEKQEQALRTGRLIEHRGGIFELSQGQVSRRVSALITRLLGIEKIFSLGLARGGQVYAQASILSRSGACSGDMTVLEAFATQAAVALCSRHSERTLRESQELCNTLFEMLSSAVALVDLEGRITKTNRRSAEFFGFDDDDEMIGSRLVERIAEPERDRVSRLLADVGATGRTASVECQLVRRDGTLLPAELSSTTITGDDEQVTGIMVIATPT